MDTVALNISKTFKNTSQDEKKTYKLKAEASRTYPFTGESAVTSLSFNFLDGAKIILACYIMNKEANQDESFLTSISNKKDTFRVDARSRSFINYLEKKQ